jgi:hypothetical protein
MTRTSWHPAAIENVAVAVVEPIEKCAPVTALLGQVEGVTVTFPPGCPSVVVVVVVVEPSSEVESDPVVSVAGDGADSSFVVVVLPFSESDEDESASVQPAESPVAVSAAVSSDDADSLLVLVSGAISVCSVAAASLDCSVGAAKDVSSCTADPPVPPESSANAEPAKVATVSAAIAAPR